MLDSVDEIKTTKKKFWGKPLLGFRRKEYETTGVSEDMKIIKSVSSDSEEYEWDMLTENEDSDESDEIVAIDFELNEIEQLVEWAHLMDEHVEYRWYRYSTMPPWLLRSCLFIFIAITFIACCVGILAIFAIEPDYMPLYRGTIVSIAIVGNCLGSAAVTYSGSQRADFKTLLQGAERLRIISEILNEHIEYTFLNRLVLRRAKESLEKEANKLDSNITSMENVEKEIKSFGKDFGHSVGKLSRQNYRLIYEQREIAKEKKKYKKNLDYLNRNTKNLNLYPIGAQRRSNDLSAMVSRLSDAIPEIDYQIWRLEQFRNVVENAATKVVGDVDTTWTKVQSMFGKLTQLSIRLERIMLYRLMDRVLSTTRNRDAMSITAFKRFLTQIPEVYVEPEDRDWWLEQLERDGYIWRTNLNYMIDKITLKKIQDEEEKESDKQIQV